VSARFVQIAASGEDLYALDEDGVVWEYAPEDRGWLELHEDRLELEEVESVPPPEPPETKR
jgi:hypothetical protein